MQYVDMMTSWPWCIYLLLDTIMAFKEMSCLNTKLKESCLIFNNVLRASLRLS